MGTTATGKGFAVGLKRAVIFQLDANGYPAASGSAAYEGLEVVGPKAWSLTNPEARKINHVGNDRVLAIDYLPPTEGASAELRVAANDIVTNAVLGSVSTFAAGEKTMMVWNSDEQGSEPDIGLLLFQQSLDSATKARRYRYHIIPSGRAIPAPGSMDENAAEERYMVAPNPTTKHLWGTTMVAGTEGATEASIVEGQSVGRPNIVAHKGDAVTVAFLLPTAKQCTSVDKMVVWVNGVLQSSGITKAVTGVTFDVAPADGAMIVVFYEY